MIKNSFILLSIFLLFNFSVYGQKKKKVKVPKKDFLITMTTSKGNIYLLLYDETPKHKENFLKLTNEGFYNSTAFHRVIKNFMIQGGDPNSKDPNKKNMYGQGGPGYTVDAEFVDKFKHKKGALAAARQGDRTNPTKASSGSQFYIVHNPSRCKHLNGSYTVYGEVIKGMDVVDKIANVPVSRRGNIPADRITIEVTAKEMKRKKITKLYGYKYPKVK
ncbi:MAG: peptidylprolyl isomerase [Bacteroidia bacterium]|nr:peptidylprolyl isomerase [Bacteroidia bacterium]